MLKSKLAALIVIKLQFVQITLPKYQKSNQTEQIYSVLDIKGRIKWAFEDVDFNNPPWTRRILVWNGKLQFFEIKRKELFDFYEKPVEIFRQKAAQMENVVVRKIHLDIYPTLKWKSRVWNMSQSYEA